MSSLKVSAFSLLRVSSQSRLHIPCHYQPITAEEIVLVPLDRLARILLGPLQISCSTPRPGSPVIPSVQTKERCGGERFDCIH